MTETIDTTAEEIGGELVPVQPAPANLFRTDDPVDVLERATRVAQALKSVIDKQGLVSRIQGREHVRVEGWTTLGSMLGVVPVVEWTRKTDDGWEARVVAQTLDGRTVGAAEASCSKSERTWKSRDDYALRSMAQTRATSKALRGPLGFVVTLAGYEATPAEEMPSDGAAESRTASVKQLNYLKTLFKRHQCTAADIRGMLRGAGVECADDANPVPLVDALSSDQASAVIDFLTSGNPLPDPGVSDVPADADGFVHEPAGDGEFARPTEVGPS
jgi:hypothetical protein